MPGVGVKFGALPGQKLPHTAKHAAAGYTPGTQQHNLRQPVGVDFRLHRRVRQQGFQLAGKQQPTLPLGVKQRLDTAAVTRQKQNALLHRPHRKGKNAVAALHTSAAPLRIGVQQHLGVRMSGKLVSAALQGGAQLRRVVQLAVIYHHIGFALPVQLHGLGAVFGVNDAQSCVQQRRPPAAIDAPLVGSAPRQRFLHSAKRLIVFLHGAGAAPHLPRYATHKKPPLQIHLVRWYAKGGHFKTVRFYPRCA